MYGGKSKLPGKWQVLRPLEDDLILMFLGKRVCPKRDDLSQIFSEPFIKENKDTILQKYVCGYTNRFKSHIGLRKTPFSKHIFYFYIYRTKDTLDMKKKLC